VRDSLFASALSGGPHVMRDRHMKNEDEWLVAG